jgi:transcriptional regulator of nitric oxide reductase
MFKAIKEFFTGKPAVQETVTEAPYKVEVQPQVAAVVETPVTVAVEGAGLVEAPAKKPRAKKPAAPKAPAVKKPRKTK